MSEKAMIAEIDEWLDRNAGPEYQTQPLAQDWARVGKVIEELGEAIAEFILYTGQNPRKLQDPKARERLLEELADVAATAIFAIQHFTKNQSLTLRIFNKKLAKIHERTMEEI